MRASDSVSAAAAADASARASPPPIDAGLDDARKNQLAQFKLERTENGLNRLVAIKAAIDDHTTRMQLRKAAERSAAAGSRAASAPNSRPPSQQHKRPPSTEGADGLGAAGANALKEQRQLLHEDSAGIADAVRGSACAAMRDRPDFARGVFHGQPKRVSGKDLAGFGVLSGERGRAMVGASGSGDGATAPGMSAQLAITLCSRGGEGNTFDEGDAISYMLTEANTAPPPPVRAGGAHVLTPVEEVVRDSAIVDWHDKMPAPEPLYVAKGAPILVKLTDLQVRPRSGAFARARRGMRARLRYRARALTRATMRTTSPRGGVVRQVPEAPGRGSRSVRAGRQLRRPVQTPAR